jgi:hypothetical protein
MLSLTLPSCGTAASSPTVRSSGLAQWNPALGVHGVVDLSTLRRDGAVTVAAGGRLALLRGGVLAPFARGPGGYAASPGDEPYIALSSGRRLQRFGCSFGEDVIYALKLGARQGIVAIDARGRASRFVDLPSVGVLTGITFDTTGRFGGRLLVIASGGRAMSLFAIDCHRHVALLTSSAPRAEGGIAVAPRSFGAFAGDLIAPDENSGRIYAITSKGASRLLAVSDLPHGGDVGVESLGFVPRSLPAGWTGLVADRGTPGNPHPGDDAILGLRSAALHLEGVQSGNLLVASEGGAQTDAIRCERHCVVRHVADGPSRAHVEGHIVFVRER